MRSSTWRITLIAVVAVCGSLRAGTIAGDNAAPTSLPQRIDALIDARAEADHVPVAAIADDAEFLRRVYLDLNGTIPTSAEARAFLADTSADKRTRLIDTLLASPRYAQHMAERFNVMLMERRAEHDGWMTFLRTAFEQNRPWDKLAAQIIDPDPNDDVNKDAAFFYTERLAKVGQQATDYPGLTRDVGRLFAGMDLQCAQCHRHLTIDDYNQADFQGLFTIYLNIEIANGVKHPAVTEKVMDKPIEFVSVFKKTPQSTGPRVPGTGREIAIPKYANEDDMWLVKPDKKNNVAGVPKFSPLHELADGLCNADNGAFRRNIANRLWAYMLGRGLVEPLDLHHSENPPSHPQLLTELADAMVAQKFDIRWTLRQIALSQTYQRSSRLPDGVDASKAPANRFTVAEQRHLTAEQLMRATLVATGEWAQYEKDASKLKEMRKRFVAAMANPPREPEDAFAPSLGGALFLMNDERVLELLQPREGNLVDRLTKLDDPRAIAEELYLSVLTRMPTDAERADVAALLKARAKDDKTKASTLSELTWAMLASTEFAVNH